jgi:hypothetical protein
MVHASKSRANGPTTGPCKTHAKRGDRTMFDFESNIHANNFHEDPNADIDLDKRFSYANIDDFDAFEDYLDNREELEWLENM